MEIEFEKYVAQRKVWPQEGRHILGQHTKDYVIVYQAFKPSLAEYAVEHQRFGGAEYNPDRMSWIKTNFLWMMYRSGWATKPNQERILAIFVKLDGFEEILRNAYTGKLEKHEGVEKDDIQVRLQWDPDHDPYGEKVLRRAIQLGLKANIRKQFNEEWILEIKDVTDFVKEQHEFVLKNDLDNLTVPRETEYRPLDDSVYDRVFNY
eukprot:TCONS_00067121-protein